MKYSLWIPATIGASVLAVPMTHEFSLVARKTNGQAPTSVDAGDYAKQISNDVLPLIPSTSEYGKRNDLSKRGSRSSSSSRTYTYTSGGDGGNGGSRGGRRGRGGGDRGSYGGDDNTYSNDSDERYNGGDDEPNSRTLTYTDSQDNNDRYTYPSASQDDNHGYTYSDQDDGSQGDNGEYTYPSNQDDDDRYTYTSGNGDNNSGSPGQTTNNGYSNQEGSGPTSGSSSGFLPESDFKNQMLQAHNDARANHNANPLSWSTALVASSKRSLGDCPYDSNHHNEDGIGENKGYNSRFNPYGWVMNNWVTNEYENYNFDTSQKGSGKSGHMTQVVWKETTEVGCVVKKCTRYYYYLCNYAPQGNMNYRKGEYADMVAPPRDQNKYAVQD